MRGGSGGGTIVTLNWSRAGAATPPTDWQLATFAPLMILGAAAFVLNVGLGAQQWLHSDQRAVAVAGIIAVGGLTLLVSRIAPTVSSAAPPLACLTLIATVLALNTPQTAGLDWRYWYLGAMTPAVGALSYRWPGWVGLLAPVLPTASVILVDISHGRSLWACLGGPVPVLIVTGLAGFLLRRAMDAARAKVTSAGQRDAGYRRAIAVDQERSREAATRVAQLAKAVEPALRQISENDRLTIDQAIEFKILGLATRDQLEAPFLVTGEMVDLLSTARAAGVVVDIISLDSSAGRPIEVQPDDPGIVRLRSGITALLVAIVPPSRLRVVWRAGPPASGAATAVSTDIAGVRHRLEQALAKLPDRSRLEISSDADALLIEFSG